MSAPSLPAGASTPAGSSADRVHEPVAVVGIGLRFPGDLSSPDELWDVLSAGTSTIGRIPSERWDSYRAADPESARILRKATSFGGVLSDVAGFDAEFFGISPREAEQMDPQQRLLLEVAWEAVEHAGIPMTALAGTRTGVFVGVSADDYGKRLLEDIPRIDSRTSIGTAVCAAANRLSYTYDLRGPSVAVDTACSSSLVALHLASQSLRLGESEVALAAGVNVLLSPGPIVSFDQAGGLAPDGRCKTFDAAADGFVRAEGAGVVVLKRLSDAQRDGDRVLAVLRGSAVNSDGRSDGIMAPNPAAQEEVLRLAYADAGVAPATVGYVEAHGTGTYLGDPIEAGSIGTVVGAGRAADAPLLIGSVKTNIGHLEAGAGVAGLAKVVLALQHEEIPPNLNFETLNPRIPLDDLHLRIVLSPTAWPRGEAPRRAGVSSYGYGGTNAHLVVEEAPLVEAAPAPTDAAADARPKALALSAASPAGLADAATRLADWLDTASPDPAPTTVDVPAADGATGDDATPARGAGVAADLGEVAATLSRRRAHLPERLVAVGDRETLVEALRGYAADGSAPAAATGTASVAPLVDGTLPAGPVFVFSGHGSQWTGMGRELLATEPVFAAMIDELDPIFREEGGFSLRDALSSWDMGETGTHQLQPLIFAMQVGLSALWRSWGIVPGAVLGHSLGELASAVVSGALSPTDGARLVCRRSALWPRVMGKGALALVMLPADEVARRIAGRTDVSLAIYSSPGSTVVGGDIPAVEELIERWTAEGLLVRRVATDVAFHCPQMDGLVDDLISAVEDLPADRPRVPVYTTALPDPRSEDVFTPYFWGSNLRSPVRFAQAVAAAAEDGHRIFLEVSPHPVITSSVDETLEDAKVTDGIALHTIRRNKPERAIMLGNLGALHCAGSPVDWSLLYPSGRLVDLPTRPWRHRRHWAEHARRRAVAGQHDPERWTLLGSRLAVAADIPVDVWQTTLSAAVRPTPAEYVVRGTSLVPAAVLAGTLLDAAGAGLAAVTFGEPLSPAAAREVQVVGQDGRLRLSSRPEGADESWATHATALVAAAPGAAAVVDADAPPPELVADDPLRALLVAYGVDAPAFDWQVGAVGRRGDRLTAEVSVPAPAEAEPAATEGSWAPWLDVALHLPWLATPDEPMLRLPAGADRIAVRGLPPRNAVLHVRPAAAATAAGAPLPGDGQVVDVLAVDEAGEPVLELLGLRFTGLDGAPVPPASAAEIAYDVIWKPAGPAAGTPADGATAPAAGTAVGAEAAGGTAPVKGARAAGAAIPAGLVVVMGAGPLADALSERLVAVGAETITIDSPANLGAVREGLTAGGAVVLLPPADAEPSLDAATAGAWRLAQVAVELGDWGSTHPPRLWSLTAGVREGALAHAPIWGLAQVVHGEHPELRSVAVDLDPAADPADTANGLVALLAAGSAEGVVALRGGELSVPRLAPLDAPATGPVPRCRPDGTYVVTGGLGDLGLATARWLADRGARTLLLLGRRGLPPRADWATLTEPADVRRVAAVRALEASGVTVRTLALDIAAPEDPADAAGAAVLTRPDELGLPPVRGIVHAAGITDDQMLDDLDEASLRGVLAPKVAGALTLHRLFPPGTLDFLVLFSSASAWMGLPGHASYAGANAFLDALGRHRRALGDGTVSFGWGAWRGLGLALAGGAVLDNELGALGSRAMSPAEAFRGWEYAARRDAGYAAIMPLDRAAPGTRRLAIFADLAAEGAEADAAEAIAWGELSTDELLDRLAAEVTRHVAAEMKLSAGAVDPRRALAELGLDSIMSLAIRRRLEAALGLTLPATLLWNQPTVTALVGYLAGRLSPAAAEAAEAGDSGGRDSGGRDSGGDGAAGLAGIGGDEPAEGGLDALLAELEAGSTAGPGA